MISPHIANSSASCCTSGRLAPLTQGKATDWTPLHPVITHGVSSPPHSCAGGGFGRVTRVSSHSVLPSQAQNFFVFWKSPADLAMMPQAILMSRDGGRNVSAKLQTLHFITYAHISSAFLRDWPLGLPGGYYQELRRRGMGSLPLGIQEIVSESMNCSGEVHNHGDIMGVFSAEKNLNRGLGLTKLFTIPLVGLGVDPWGKPITYTTPGITSTASSNDKIGITIRAEFDFYPDQLATNGQLWLATLQRLVVKAEAKLFDLVYAAVLFKKGHLLKTKVKSLTSKVTLMTPWSELPTLKW